MREKMSLGGRLNCFMIGGITNVPKERFPYHMEMIHAVRMLLQYRYNVNFSSALLDNESKLDEVPREARTRVCYDSDQASVEWSDFLVAELSVPSTGTGQELERAAARGKPVIALMQADRKTASSITYYMETYEGGLVPMNVYIGKGGLSPMVEGNPTVLYIVTYPHDTSLSKSMQALDNALWGLQYSRLISRFPHLRELLEKAFFPLHSSLERKNPRTMALHELDDAVKKVLELRPQTAELEQIRNAAGADPSIPKQERDSLVADAEKKIMMLERLRNFHPRARHEQHDKYRQAFPHAAERSPRADGNGQAAPFERVITGKFGPAKTNGGNNGSRRLQR